MRARAGVVLTMGGLWLAACTSRATPLSRPSDAAPELSFSDASTYDPLDDSDAALGTRVGDLFRSARCAGGAETFCHGAGAASLRLRLGDGGDVVGVPSQQRPELLRVAPFDAEASYLYLKVRGDGGIDGDVMPLGIGYDVRIERLVHAWIEAGAPSPR